MTYERADRTRYETPQGSRYRNVQGQIRCPAEDVAGTEGTVCCGCVGSNRNSPDNSLRLGKSPVFSDRGRFAKTRRSPRNQGSDALARSLDKNSGEIFKKIAEIRKISPVMLTVRENRPAGQTRTARLCRRASQLATGAGFLRMPCQRVVSFWLRMVKNSMITLTRLCLTNERRAR